MTLRLIFMGTPDFAVPTLKALVAAGHEVVRVLTQPPAAAQRGKKLRKSAVHLAAEELGLEVMTPTTLKDEVVQKELAGLNADAGIVVAYGQILPKAVLEAPRLGCLNLHGSLLPRWRGAAPMQRAILAGDSETGVQVMQMEKGLDTGPVYATFKMPIGPDTNAGHVHDTLAQEGARLMVEALPQIADGALKGVPQADEGMTYARKIRKEESRIDWSQPAEQIDRQVRAFAPFPGAWCEMEIRGKPERVRILKARPVEGMGVPGEILATPLVIACGQGALAVEAVQRAGKGMVDVKAFLNGAPLAPGDGVA